MSEPAFEIGARSSYGGFAKRDDDVSSPARRAREAPNKLSA
jgi:hypothetical protein